MSSSPVQPIVIWFGRVGDMILLSALLEILHRRYGRPCHLIGAGSWPLEIYATHPDVGRVSCLHRYTAYLFDGAWWRTLAALRAAHDAPVYVCETDPAKLARIRRLLRLSGTASARCIYLTEQAALQEKHWVDKLVSFGRATPAAFSATDYPWPSPPPRAAPYLEVSAAAQTECAAWLSGLGLEGRTLVLLQPGNRRTMRGRGLKISAADDKAWPIEDWAALTRRIHARLPQAAIMLCGAPRETLLLQWIVAAAQLAAVIAAEVPLPRLLALCARAHSMVSVDTGPAHAAAALSLPLVVLFGGNSQAEWLPRSPTGSAVLGLGGPPASRRLAEITVERVFEAWCSLPGTAGAPGGVTRPAARATAPQP
jgi:ADP-heptose:LPS heptosyltransferase